MLAVRHRRVGAQGGGAVDLQARTHAHTPSAQRLERVCGRTVHRMVWDPSIGCGAAVGTLGLRSGEGEVETEEGLHALDVVEGGEARSLAGPAPAPPPRGLPSGEGVALCRASRLAARWHGPPDGGGETTRALIGLKGLRGCGEGERERPPLLTTEPPLLREEARPLGGEPPPSLE